MFDYEDEGGGARGSGGPIEGAQCWIAVILLVGGPLYLINEAIQWIGGIF